MSRIFVFSHILSVQLENVPQRVLQQRRQYVARARVVSLEKPRKAASERRHEVRRHKGTELKDRGKNVVRKVVLVSRYLSGGFNFPGRNDVPSYALGLRDLSTNSRWYFVTEASRGGRSMNTLAPTLG